MVELFCKDVGVRDVVLLLFGTEVALCSLLLLSRWSKGGDVGIGGDTAVDIGSANFPSAIDFNIACGILNPYSFCNIISISNRASYTIK